MATVELSHLTKVFSDGTVAVNDLNIDFGDHELSVLVGPSGSGKTTILRLIAGLEEATGGKIRINNQDVTNLPPQDRNVSMVFQNYVLYPHMTVRENLGFALRMKGRDKSAISKQVEKVARLLQIERHLNKRPENLSGGEQQRVALGRAIARQADVILLDEPLSNLDANLRTEMRMEIRNLQKDLDLTMIFVTHDQREAMSIGDTMALIREGELQQTGNPLDLYQNPTNAFVASFLGTPSINLVDMDLVVDQNNTVRLTCKDFQIRIGSAEKRGIASLFGSCPDKLNVGIRPEHISFCDPKESDIVGTIFLIENFGNNCHYHVDLGYNKLVVLSTPRDRNLGEIGLKINASNVFLFSSRNGSVILKGLRPPSHVHV